MPRFAANLDFLYTERPFMERFAAAAADGFHAVELLFPYGHSARDLAQQLADHRLTLLFFNATQRAHPQERGIACLPDQRAAFRNRFLQALDYAQALRCPWLHVMSGLVPAHTPRNVLRQTYVENLQWAAERAQALGCGLLIEPINPTDMPGFFLTRQDEAHALVQAVSASNVRVMMDLYHCAQVEGDVVTALKTHLPTGRVGHLQIAGLPDRHEPEPTGTAGDNATWSQVFRLIDELGYTGWVGAEYRPRRGVAPGATSAGLQWLRGACESPAPAPALRPSPA